MKTVSQETAMTVTKRRMTVMRLVLVALRLMLIPMSALGEFGWTRSNSRDVITVPMKQGLRVCNDLFCCSRAGEFQKVVKHRQHGQHLVTIRLGADVLIFGISCSVASV